MDWSRSCRGFARICLLAVAAVSLHAGSLRAQPHFLFERIGVREGLSSDAVTALWQDEQGFVWVGTADGLNRYDGFDVVEANAFLTPSLRDGFVNPGAMIGDSTRLWVGTRGGLYAVDLATGRTGAYVHDEADAASLSHNSVTALALTASGDLWVGTDRGLNKLEATAKSFRRYLNGREPEGLTYAAVTSLACDKRGRLWVGTRHGLNYVDLETGRVRQITGAFEETYITALLFDAATGVLWVGTREDGVLAYDPFRATVPRRIAPAEENPYQRWVTGLAADGEGGAWVTTWGGGLCHARLATRTVFCVRADFEDPESLASDFATSVLVDASGALWVGTWDGVSLRLGEGAFRHTSYDESRPAVSLTNPRVLSITSTEETVWIGTQGGGLQRLDPGSGRVTPVSLGEPAGFRASVWSLDVDTTGGIWAATQDLGVLRYDPRTGRVTAFRHVPGDSTSLGNDLTYTVFHDRQGTLWVGTVTAGLDRFDRDRRGFVHYRHDPKDATSLSFDSVWPLLEDHEGTLWIGTVGGGLNRYDRSTGRFRAYRHDASDPPSLSSDRVVSLAETPGGALWIGTIHGGLNRYDRATDSFTRFGPEQGLAHRNAVCILPGEGEDVWIGTSYGLSHFDAAQERFYTYRERQGLPATTFLPGACHRTADGTLYFGTADGVVSFRPQDVRSPAYHPKVVISSLAVVGELFHRDTLSSHLRDLRLPYDRNFVEFTYAALHPAASGQYVYRFRLDELDTEWRSAGSRRYASYAALRPGRYTFRVQAAAPGQSWDEAAETRLDVRIAPALWQTWWFRTVAVLLLLALAAGMYQYYRYYRRLEDRARHALSMDLHDNILSKMAMLALDLEVAGRRAAPQEQSLRDVLHEGAGHVRFIMKELREVSRRVRNVDRSAAELVEDMRQTAWQLLVHHECIVQDPAVVPAVRVPGSVATHVLAIYREAIHNAIRHGQARRVEINLAFEDGWFSFTVRDDGAGFDVEAQASGKGIQNMRDRAALVRGRLSIESEPGDGSKIALYVKIA